MLSNVSIMYMHAFSPTNLVDKKCAQGRWKKSEGYISNNKLILIKQHTAPPACKYACRDHIRFLVAAILIFVQTKNIPILG